MVRRVVTAEELESLLSWQEGLEPPDPLLEALEKLQRIKGIIDATFSNDDPMDARHLWRVLHEVREEIDGYRAE